jgi:hypothetical protein
VASNWSRCGDGVTIDLCIGNLMKIGSCLASLYLQDIAMEIGSNLHLCTCLILDREHHP